MSNPLVSVITPVYNSVKYLALSVGSVMDQTYPDWELWLIDDCSTDGSRALIETLAAKDQRIKPVLLEKNSGPAVARNAGIQKAGGRYIAFLDADDIWKPEKLEVQVAFMQANHSVLSYSHYEVIDKDGNHTGRMITCPPTIRYKKLLLENRIGCLTGMYDVKQTGPVLMPDIFKRQDYGFWLNILKTGVTGHGIQQSLAYYRKYNTSLSGNKLNVIRYNWALLRKHQGMNFLQSSYYFLQFMVHKGTKYIFKHFSKQS